MATPIGGRVTVDVLPEAGIYGNGHTMMLEKNNKQIMHPHDCLAGRDRLSAAMKVEAVSPPF